MLPEQTIVVRGERIVAVTPADQVIDLPADATRIDGRGKFALPGLIDAHVHVVHVLDFAHVTGDEVLPLYLAAGVTSDPQHGRRDRGRDAGGAVRRGTSSIRRRASSLAARCWTAIRRSTATSAGPSPIRPRFRALFDELQPWHVTTVKIYAGTGPDVGRAIIDEGHRRGLFVTAHLGAYTAQHAVADGIDGLEHIWSRVQLRDSAEVSGSRAIAGALDLDNPLCEALVAELAERKTYVDPTLAVFRNMILLPDVPEVRDPSRQRARSRSAARLLADLPASEPAARRAARSKSAVASSPSIRS